jgi:hypothetical protein
LRVLLPLVEGFLEALFVDAGVFEETVFEDALWVVVFEAGSA